MTTSIFKTKDEFFAFKKAWAKASQKGLLTSAHMMLYNIIRGKHPEYGFTPTINIRKMANSGYVNYGVYHAGSELKRYKDWAAQVISALQNDRKISGWTQQWLDNFLEPFDGTLTAQNLYDIVNLPKVEPIPSNFGRGKRLVEAFEAGMEVPRTCIELNEVYNTFEKEEAA